MTAQPPEPATDAAPGVPRWVKAFGIIALVLILLFVGMHLATGGGGPVRHGPPASLGEPAAPVAGARLP